MKQKLKLSKIELMELTSILQVYYNLHINNETYPQVIINTMVYHLIYKLFHKIMPHKDNYTISLRSDEALTLRYVLITTEFTDPFQLSLSERIKLIQIL